MTDGAPYLVPDLPFEPNALAPAIGPAALADHHARVHRGYAAAVNHILAGFPDLAG